MADKVENANGGSRKPRVLVVENDPDIRALNAKKLTYWDYEPVVAQGCGNALLEDARQKVRRFRCHLALVDLHLLDDYDRDDWSGLKLVPDLQPARAVIYSGSADYQAGREAVGEYGALIYVGKSEGPVYLRKVLDQYAERFCACRSPLVINWPPGLSPEIVTGRMFPNQPDVPPEEVEDLLVVLFPQARQLSLDFLGSYPAVLSEARVRSLILQVRADDAQPLILKLIRVEKLNKEVENYRLYVRNQLLGSYRPSLQAHHSLYDLGGAVYAFVGISEKFQSFSQYYRTASAHSIKIALRRFFEGVWSPWYQRAAVRESVSLYDLYSGVWGGNWWIERLVEQTQSGLVPPFSQVWPKGQPPALPDPLPWLLDCVRAGQAGVFPRVPVTVTHGDLRGDNLLVDAANQNAWVLDFERTGEGHILQDFVELEVDILTHLAPLEDDELDLLYTLFRLAAAPDRLGRIADPSIDDPRLVKALDVISTLRRLAVKLTGLSGAHQYLWGLLFNALFRVVVLIQAGQPAVKVKKALLLAAILCHRLEHWGQDWPPPGPAPSDSSSNPIEGIIEEHHA